MVKINSIQMRWSFLSDFKDSINSIDLSYVKMNNNDLKSAFDGCHNLTRVVNINESIINMDYTFRSCSNLVNAPVIPNSVIDMHDTFSWCSNLVNAPVIPNSVIDMDGTFYSCRSLVNAPVIPNSVTNMSGTFYDCSLVNAPVIPNSVTNMYLTFSLCTNLTGDIPIYSNQITNALFCFDRSYFAKDVYIPFTYENGVNTLTYNSFINAGYLATNRVNGVLLKDINTYQS